jgi:hypothetical protein
MSLSMSRYSPNDLYTRTRVLALFAAFKLGKTVAEAPTFLPFQEGRSGEDRRTIHTRMAELVWPGFSHEQLGHLVIGNQHIA